VSDNDETNGSEQARKNRRPLTRNNKADKPFHRRGCGPTVNPALNHCQWRLEIIRRAKFSAWRRNLDAARFTRFRGTALHIPAWIKLVLVILTLGILFSPGIQHHWKIGRNPYFVPFDAVLNIPAFFKYDPIDPIPTTLLKEYHLDTMSPPLYKATLVLGAQFTDVRHFQLAMMYLAYACFIAVLGRLGWLLGGASLSFAVMAITITAWIYIGLGFIGGAARMYAYPSMALILYALLRDRPQLLALTAILGALLYPIVAVIAGLCLTGWLILPLYARHGVVSRWSLRRRLVTLGLTGLITLGCLVPLMVGGQKYGRRILVADIPQYPEAGSDGNYRPFDQQPYQIFGTEIFSYYLGPMYSHGEPLVPQFSAHKNLNGGSLLASLAAVGIFALTVATAGLRKLLRSSGRAAGLRLIGFFIACSVLHVISWLAAPFLYVPTRYFMFSLPFIVTFIFPWSLYLLVGSIGRLQDSPKLRGVVFLGLVVIYLAAFGGRGNVEFEKGSLVPLSSQPLLDAIAALPKTSLIAGWPYGEMKNIEYVTRRNAFLTAELHQVLHLGFIEIMRQRMDAVFDAYLSVDAAPLRRLRDQFGVTHLLVETHHFTDPKRPPEYFAPWRSRIGPRLDAIKNKAYLIDESLLQKAAVYNRNGLILLDLARLP
jgi:hypothetical protein